MINKEKRRCFKHIKKREKTILICSIFSFSALSTDISDISSRDLPSHSFFGLWQAEHRNVFVSFLKFCNISSMYQHLIFLDGLTFHLILRAAIFYLESVGFCLESDPNSCEFLSFLQFSPPPPLHRKMLQELSPFSLLMTCLFLVLVAKIN